MSTVPSKVFWLSEDNPQRLPAGYYFSDGLSEAVGPFDNVIDAEVAAREYEEQL